MGQSKVEIGVLEIMLGPALECCAQGMEDYEDDVNKLNNSQGLSPAYVRFFPLISPSEAIPIEGDAGKSTRPLESEKIQDNLFTEYFAPCIKLALMFRPNEVDGDHTGSGSANSTHTEQYAYARLDQISAALISRTKELLSFSSRGVDLRISGTKVPVILAPTPVKLPLPTLPFMCWKNNIRFSEMASYEYLAIHVQEMDLKIEESSIHDVWEFYLDVMKNREARANIWQPQDTKINFYSFEVEECGNSIE